MAKKKLILEAKWSGATATKGLGKLNNSIKKLALGSKSVNRNFRTLNKTLAQTGALSGGISAGAIGGGRRGGGRGGGGRGGGGRGGGGRGGAGGLLLGGSGKFLPAIGGAIALGLAARRTGRYLSGATTSFADFGRKMKLVALISGSTAEGLEKMTKAAIRLAPEMGKAPIEIADAFQALASAELNTTEVIAAGSDVMKLSILRHGDLAETARLVAGTLKQFGIEASKTQSIVSRMATTISTSLFNNIDELGLAMQAAGAEGSAMGHSLESVLATIGLLQNTTRNAANTGIVFRTLLVNVKKESKILSKALKAMGLSYGDVDSKVKNSIEIINAFSKSTKSNSVLIEQLGNIYEKRFGGKIAKAVFLVRDGTKSLTKAVEQQEATLKRVDREWGEFMTGLRAEMDKTSVEWGLLKLEIGEGLAPSVLKGLGGVRGLAQVLRGKTVTSGGVMDDLLLPVLAVKAFTTIQQRGRNKFREEQAQAMAQERGITVSGAGDVGAPIVINNSVITVKDFDTADIQQGD